MSETIESPKVEFKFKGKSAQDFIPETEEDREQFKDALQSYIDCALIDCRYNNLTRADKNELLEWVLERASQLGTEVGVCAEVHNYENENDQDEEVIPEDMGE